METANTTHNSSFFAIAKRWARKLPFVLDAVALFYCMMDERTPVWAKASIGVAIAYFVSPVDAIPDVLFIIGWTDDAAVIAGTVKAIDSALEPRHYAEARKALA